MSRTGTAGHVFLEDVPDGRSATVKQDPLIRRCDVEHLANLGRVEVEHVAQRHHGALAVG
jgi:hypothetical protein